MADRTYKLSMLLSDGSEVEAGTFTVPAGDPGEDGLFYCGETGSSTIAGNSPMVLKYGLFNRTPKAGDKGSGIGFPLGVSDGKIYLFTFTVNSVDAVVNATCNTVDTVEVGGSSMVGYLKVLCFSGIAIPSVGNSTSYPFAVGSLEVKNGDKVLICRPGDTIFSNAIALVTVTDELSNTAQTNWLMEASSGGGLSEVPTVIIRDHTNPIPVEGSITSFPYTMVSGASNNGKIYGLTPTSKTFAVIFWTYQNVKAIGCGYFHSVSNGNKYYFNILEVFQTS